MGDGVKALLAKPIQLADQVIKWADFAHSFKTECAELKVKTERLAALLRQAARFADLYERPARRIMNDTEQALAKTLTLISKCRHAGLVKRALTLIPAAAFKKLSVLLDNSSGDVSWLLRVSAAADGDDGGHLGLPPIAQNDPILFLIWEQIAILSAGPLHSRAEAAASLASLARDNDRNVKLIIEEDGVPPLLRLLAAGGSAAAQEAAARTIGLLARDQECVEQMVLAGVCSSFAKALKESPMAVQSAVAWATAELAANHPKSQDAFAQNNAIRLLVGHLAFETIEEHSRYTIPSTKVTSIHSAVLANKHPLQTQMQMHNVVQSTVVRSTGATGNVKGRELEDPAAKTHMKAMAAKALWQLARGNPAICRSITESRALLCFAILLEKGEEEVRYNSALALMEIARIAEHDADLRRSAFKPKSPAALAVVDQLVRIVERAEHDNLLIPCIVSLGCLTRIFQATETRIIGPLVQLLDEREAAVEREAVIALTKFACTENYLHLDHSKAIIASGGAKHLVQLAYFEDTVLQLHVYALILLCYIALHVPDSEALAQAEVLTVLQWASKQGFFEKVPELESLLPEAKIRLELYQSRGFRGYH